MTSPLPIQFDEQQYDHNQDASRATITFSDQEPFVKIIRQPGFTQPPLLYISIGVVLAWMRHYIPESQPD